MPRKRPKYLHSGTLKSSEDSENDQVSGLIANGGAEKDVNNRVKTAWPKWRDTTGVMCDMQEHTNKVEIQSVQDGYKTGHGVWSRMLGS